MVEQAPVAHAEPADPAALLEMGAFLNWLRAQTDEILAEADAERMDNESLSGEAVNWADLKCNKAEVWRDDAGEGGFRVYVDEAAPEAYKFARWIVDRLQSRGIMDVEVVTEW